jgi:hypothetical protein
MSWSISNIDNTVEISKKCAKDLFEAQRDDGEDHGEFFWNPDDVTYEGKLRFNPDHDEHMDYVGDDRIQKVLKKHKVKGDITFGDLESSREGSFWGYRFDGKGGMKELKGKLVWS